MLDQKNLVIISSSKNELLTQSLATIQGVNLITISLTDFLNSVTLFDEVSIDKTTIHWKKDNKSIQNDHDTIILSRLFYRSLNTFDEFITEDKNYALSEINAYLGFALHSFNLLNYAIDENGHEILHPLPTQWNIIKSLDKKHITPDYYWGDYRFNYLQGKNLVYIPLANEDAKWCKFKQWWRSVLSLSLRDCVSNKNYVH